MAAMCELCTLPEVAERQFDSTVSPHRARLLRIHSVKWMNGSTLRYFFFDKTTDGEWRGAGLNRKWVSFRGEDEQKDVVRAAFQVWADVGIGIKFQEVDNREDAEIRIGFGQGDGSWSYVGRAVVSEELNIGKNERTMNFGWDLTRTPTEIDTAVHEIGHALGFPHEHQNPNAGIVWNEEAVYTSLAGPPNNWTRAQTYRNIISKLPQAEVEGSDWDKDSIMHYPFGPGMILSPEEYKNKSLIPASGLSEMDKTTVKQFYPPIEEDGDGEEKLEELKPFQSQKLEIGLGEQINFKITPGSSRTYTIATFGWVDTFLALYEKDSASGELVEIASDNDGGFLRNANIRMRLIRGREYVLRARLFYAGDEGESAVMMF